MRDQRPPTQELLDGLLDGCLTFAREMLARAGEFYPFGETADATGKRSMVGGHLGQEHPNAHDVHELLETAFRESAESGRIIAAALAANVTIPPEYGAPYPDGVRVRVEAPGYSRVVFLPYQIAQRSLLGRLTKRSWQVRYAEPFSVEVSPQLFRSGA
jgi:hypothetical protein